ncbi:MAG: dipeptide epimerase [Planctomycetaceae bacterium]
MTPDDTSLSIRMLTHSVQMPLAQPFTISRGSITKQSSLIVELKLTENANAAETANGGHASPVHVISGFGEVTANRYYGHSLESIRLSLDKVRPHLDQYLTGTPESTWSIMKQILADDYFALSALDAAAHDLFAKRLKTSTWNRWGLSIDHVPESSFTIGIDSIDMMISKLNSMDGWNCYKIKLGTADDIEVIRQLRRQTSSTFRVDANCGWTAVQTIENSGHLADLGVEFIEQPMSPSASEAEKKLVFEQSALPIIADEDCQTEHDVARCREYFHGINVKLCKCGGMTPALRMLQYARTLGMKTMLGCMVESSIGISSAAQLLPLLDYADLDGALLLADQPATGVQISHGRVVFPNTAGNGGQLLRDKLDQFAIS